LNIFEGRNLHGFISQIQCKQRSMTAAVLFRGLIADDKEMICWNRNLISMFMCI